MSECYDIDDFATYDYIMGLDDAADIVCKFCNRGGFFWAITEHGWRLMTPTGRVHKCKAYWKAREESKHK